MDLRITEEQVHSLRVHLTKNWLFLLGWIFEAQDFESHMLDSRRSHLIGSPPTQLPASVSTSTASALATMMTTMQTAQRPCTAQRSSFAGSALRLPAAAPPRQQMRWAVAAETAEKEKKAEKWSAPALDPSWPSPIFGGSTGGLLRKAQVGPYPGLTHSPTDESRHRPLCRLA